MWMRDGKARHDDENGDESHQESRMSATAVNTEWNPALEKIFSDMEECDPCLIEASYLSA